MQQVLLVVVPVQQFQVQVQVRVQAVLRYSVTSSPPVQWPRGWVGGTEQQVGWCLGLLGRKENER